MSRTKYLGTTAITLSLFAVMGAAGAANAQTAAPAPKPDATTIAEVVVTARARPEKQLSIPISIQAFSAEKLAEDNIHDLSTLQAEAGFTFNSSQASYGGQGRQYPDLTFRGLWSNVGGAVGGSSGALFVDGVYVSGGFASVTFADVSSVDVLKGPQNVYFGKNTFGGAVNLITSNPTEDFHAKASVGYSTMGSYDDTASVEGAIIPGLLTGRVTAELFHQGEQYKAYDGGPLGEQDTKGVTLVLYATPSSDVWLRTRFHYSHDSDSVAAEGQVDANGENAPGGGPVYGTTCPGVLNKYFCNGIPSLGSIGNASSVLDAGYLYPFTPTTASSGDRWYNKAPTLDDAGMVRDNLQASLAGGAKLPFDSSLQFTVGYNQAASHDALRADHISLPVGTLGNPNSGSYPDGEFFYFPSDVVSINRDFSADIRLISSASNPLRGVFGLNYFRSLDQVDSSGYVFTNSLDATVAAYGSLEYDILSNLTITGEARFQRDTLTDNPSGLAYTQNLNSWLPRGLLRYKPTKDTTLYLSYSEGIQPPQINPAYVAGQSDLKSSGNAYLANALAAIGDTSAFTKDPKVRVWEIGWKQALFDRHVTFSIDYYNQFWDNALVDTFVFDPGICHTLYGQYYAENTSATCPYGSSGKESYSPSQNHIQGIEFEGTARITRKWTAHGVVNWTHAIRKEYSELSTCGMFTSGTCPNENGLVMDQVPEWQAAADTTYKDHLIDNYDWYAHGGFTYTGMQYIDPTDIGYINGYFRVNASAGIVKGNLTFEVYATNLLNDKNWDSAYRFPSAYFGYGYAHMSAIVSAPNPQNIGFKISSKF